MTPAARAVAPAVTLVAHDVGGIGGMERQLERIVTGALDAGAEVTLISRTCRLAPHARLRWIRIRAPARPFPVAYPWFWLAGTIAVARHRSGVLHVTGAVVANRADVATVHLCHAAAHRGGRLVRRRRDTVAYAVSEAVSVPLSLAAERWSYRPARVRRIVGVSDGVGRELHACYPRAGAAVATIPNGVDVEHFRPDAGRRAHTRGALGLDDSALAAVFVGGEWAAKGLEPAIGAVGACPPWHLLVVGRGDVERYRHIAARAGCADRVRFVGPAADVAAYYAAADAFVLPSSYETFSLATYEAASSGLPLLATRVSGVEDILRDGVNGWFVDRDAATIAGRLAALAADPARRRRMGRDARERARAFGWDRVVADYLDLYRRLACADGADGASQAIAPRAR